MIYDVSDRAIFCAEFHEYIHSCASLTMCPSYYVPKTIHIIMEFAMIIISIIGHISEEIPDIFKRSRMCLGIQI